MDLGKFFVRKRLEWSLSLTLSCCCCCRNILFRDTKTSFYDLKTFSNCSSFETAKESCVLQNRCIGTYICTYKADPFKTNTSVTGSWISNTYFFPFPRCCMNMFSSLTFTMQLCHWFNSSSNEVLLHFVKALSGFGNFVQKLWNQL
jgi:hypothetical protein